MPGRGRLVRRARQPCTDQAPRESPPAPKPGQGLGGSDRPINGKLHQTNLAMRVEAAPKPPASNNVTSPGFSTWQTLVMRFLYRPSTIWAGLVQPPDQIAASRNRSFFVRRGTFLPPCCPVSPSPPASSACGDPASGRTLGCGCGEAGDKVRGAAHSRCTRAVPSPASGSA